MHTNTGIQAEFCSNGYREEELTKSSSSRGQVFLHESLPSDGAAGLGVGRGSIRVQKPVESFELIDSVPLVRFQRRSEGFLPSATSFFLHSNEETFSERLMR